MYIYIFCICIYIYILYMYIYIYIYDADLRDADNMQKYVACLYWALATVSTIGYGDVLPVNHHERTFSVFVALIGVIIFAFAMGNITTLLASTQGARLRFDDKLRAVAEYLVFRDADSNLKRRITTHFGGAWRVSGELYEENELLNSCPRQAETRKRPLYSVVI